MSLRVLLLLFCCFVSFCVESQNSRKVKRLQAQKKELAGGLKQAQNELKTTDKNISTKVRDITLISSSIDEQQKYIDSLEILIEKTSLQVAETEAKVSHAAQELAKKKEDYARALRLMRVFHVVNSPMLFVLSSHNVSIAYRRSRYAREYADYQRSLAEQIIEQQNLLMKMRDELLRVKADKITLIAECKKQKDVLEERRLNEKKNMESLKQKQKKLKKSVNDIAAQLAALDKEIDQQIAYELEQARLRAEAEARRQAELQAQKDAEKVRSSVNTPSSSNDVWLTSQDRALQGSFENNKGKLPVPITGAYRIGSRFGTYDVPGLKNVQLDNKGTNYIGQKGAMARAIFDGKISAIFQFGDTRNILVRHGSYISVYCNLSSVRVAKGQRVNAHDILGVVQSDESGNAVLHFQLRKETQKLNPETWIGH